MTRTILVVEDSAPVRELVKMILEEADYTVLEAANQEDALLAIDRSAAGLELVLCDLQVPGGSGFEIGKHLRATIPGAKILYMSGHDLRLDPGGDTEFIMKPFRPDELVQKIRTMIG